MKPFDTILVADWSAGKRAGPTPKKDSIWLGITRDGQSEEPRFCRSRQEAEHEIAALIEQEKAAGRRLLCTFDFPFGYPQGFARHVTGSDDPFALWSWFEERIVDTDDGTNNRYDVAETLNGMFEGVGPFWGKSHKDRWPAVPYRKAGVIYDVVAEKRACDVVSKASSSCFQLAFPPTVGGQVMMGLPTLNRLRRMGGVRVWPFEPHEDAPVVLAEIWPGIIETSVKEALAAEGQDNIRDRTQVRLLADALARLPASQLTTHMADVPAAAREEAWILGAGLSDDLNAAARGARPLRNDCFALPQGVHWTPVDEALALLRDRLTPVTGTENIPVFQATGRIAADDVIADRANPPLPNTAVDGYGFSGERPEGMHRLRLVEGALLRGMRPLTFPWGRQSAF